MRIVGKIARVTLFAVALVFTIISVYTYSHQQPQTETVIAQQTSPSATPFQPEPKNSEVPTSTHTPQPTETPTPAPTETLVEPTFSVDTRVLEEGFAQVHVPIENLTFLKWQTVKVVKVVEGRQQTSTTQVYSVTSDTCQEQSLLDNVRRVYQAFKGQDWHTVAAMVLTESGFKQFKDSGDGCKLLQNYGGAQAYCMMQIYLPAHKSISAEELQSTDRCIEVGKAVYLGMLNGAANGDPVQAAACYKGFCQDGYFGKNDPGFIGNFSKAYNSDGMSVDGTFIPFDETRLHELFPDW